MTLLIESIASEAYRLTRNRMAVFWSVFFVPVMFVIGGLGFHMITKAKGDEMAAKVGVPLDMTPQAINLADAVMKAASNGANGAILVFVLIGAATLYAGDYRWETWRLISARNSRPNLILGKVAVLKLLALAAMVAFLIASVLTSLTQAAVFGRPLSFHLANGELAHFALLWLLSWVRIVQYLMLALLTATLTRSLLATLFVPIVVGIGQSFMAGPGIALLGWQAGDWQSQLLLPGLAYDTLKAAVEPNAPLASGVVLKPLVSLALWTLVPLVGAIAWFNRQDLSKE